MNEDEEPEGHGPDACHYDNLRRCLCMTCGATTCYFVARGDTWEEVGAEMDEHIAEAP